MKREHLFEVRSSGADKVLFVTAASCERDAVVKYAIRKGYRKRGGKVVDCLNRQVMSQSDETIWLGDTFIYAKQKRNEKRA